jgi:hypothetical protein
MPTFFFGSVLVKRFAREQGTTFVLSLLRPSAKNRLYSARITEVEVCAALVSLGAQASLPAAETENKHNHGYCIEGLLLGKHSAESPSSFERWLQRRREKRPQDAA